MKLILTLLTLQICFLFPSQAQSVNHKRDVQSSAYHVTDILHKYYLKKNSLPKSLSKTSINATVPKLSYNKNGELVIQSKEQSYIWSVTNSNIKEYTLILRTTENNVTYEWKLKMRSDWRLVLKHKDGVFRANHTFEKLATSTKLPSSNSPENQKAAQLFKNWALEHEKHLLRFGEVVIKNKKLPACFTKEKIKSNHTAFSTKGLYIIYMDKKSGRFYYDSCSVTSYNDSQRFSYNTYRNYGQITNENKVKILSKKASLCVSGISRKHQ